MPIKTANPTGVTLSTIATASPKRATGGPLTPGDHSFDASSSAGQDDQRALSFIGRRKTKGPTFPLSPEHRFLSACAASRTSSQKIRELVDLNLDWKLVLDRAVENGIASLAYFHLKNSGCDRQVPPLIFKEMRSLCRESAANAIHQSAKLKEILIAFEGKKISAIAMKGAALSEMFYEVAGMRPMLDIDLMVRGSDLDDAAAVLAKLGYASDESYQASEWYRNQHHHLAPLLSSDRSVIVELHRELASPQSNLSIATEDLWGRAQPAQIASAPALVLAPEDLILGICTHVAISKRFVRSLRDLADIGAVIAAHSSEIDWKQFIRTAVQWQASRCAYYCLWAAQTITDADIPSAVLNELKRETDLNLVEDAGVKFLIPRAIFPDSTRLKPWLINDLIGEILCMRIGVLRTLGHRLLHFEWIRRASEKNR